MKIFNLFVLNLLVVIGTIAQTNSKFVDDSTVVNISLDQTTFFLKSDIVKGDTIKRPLVQEERFDVYRHNFEVGELRQNLGMYGSASLESMQPYNTKLGAFDGVTVYDHLAHKDADVKYYDTKVPYSFLSFRQGFNATEYAEGGYTQSINERANLGMEIKRFGTLLNLGSNPSDIKFTENTTAKFHGSFISKNGSYKALVNFRYMKNSVEENGGVLYDSITETNKDSIITVDYVETQLSDVFSEEKRNEFSFYHEFRPFKNEGIKLFHELNRTKKVNSYLDENLSTNYDYYENTILDTNETSLQDSNVYKVIENSVGISGKIGQISYSGYLKNRSWKFESDTNRWDTATVVIKRSNDFYAGGDLFFQTKSRDIKALLNVEFGTDASRIELESDLKYLKLNYLTLSNSPGLKLNNFDELHYSWGNDFKNYFVTDLNIEPYYKTDKLELSGFYRLQTYNNYVYYNSDLTPVQDSETRVVNYIGGNVSYKFKKWKISQHIQYSDLSDVVFVALPDLYSYTNIDYNFKVKWLPALKTNIGVDAIYFSEYKPLTYRSDLQSFVVQDDFTEDQYLKLDAYVNFRYKTFQISLKGINLLQGVMSEGYYPTEGYFGKKRAIELGIKWNFFR